MKRVLTICLTLLTVACTEKGKPYNEHEPDRRKSDPVMITGNEPSSRPSPVAREWEQKYSAAHEPITQVLLPLADKVLDPKRVKDPKSINSQAVHEELAAFNSLMLKTAQQQAQRPEIMSLLRRYENVLTMDCTTFRDSCAGLRYLRGAANSAAVVKLAAKLDAANHYKMLLYAVELQNHTFDADLLTMLATNPLENVSQTEVKYRETVKSLLETGMQQANDRYTSPEETRRFLDAIQAWTLAGKNISEFGNSSQDALYAMMARAGYIYAPNGSLHPDFNKMLTERGARDDSFMGTQAKLKHLNTFSAELIGAQFIKKYDDLYYIIDSVFKGEMSSLSGAVLFGSSKHSLDEMRTDVQNYLRIEFLLALNESSVLAQQIFSANIQGKDLLNSFLRQSDQLKRVWATFSSHALPLRSFAIQAARQKNADLSVEREFITLFDSIQRSISLSAVYPHTMVLFYLLSQKKFAITMPFSGKTYDSGDLERFLFEGKIPPLLNYSDDDETLNQFQLVYAFDIAVRTNLFQIVNIDPDNFISDTIRRLESDDDNFIDTEISAIETRFNQTQSYPDFVRACREFSGGPVERHFYFLENRVSPYYGKLIGMAFTTVTDKSSETDSEPGSLTKYTAGVFYSDGMFNEMVERVRLNFANNIRLTRAMLAAYKATLKNKTPEQINALTAQTQKLLQEMEAKRQKVFNLAKVWYEDVGKCYWKTDNKDREVQLQLVDMTKGYLRQIHKDIGKLRAGASDTEKAQIEDHIHFTGLPSNFKGLDRIGPDGYLFNQIDLQVRFAQFIMNGLHTDAGNIPPIAPTLNIDFGHSLDLDNDLIARSPQKFLNYLDSEDEFVTAGIRTIFGDNQFTVWTMLGSGHITSWSDSIRSLASLYRLEYDLTGKNTTFTAEEILQTQEEILNLLKMLPQEREYYNLIHLDRKYDPLYLDNRLLSLDLSTRKLQDLWGLFDFAERAVSAEQLGWYKMADEMEVSKLVPRKMDMSQAGLQYYQSRSDGNRGTSIIPYGKEVDAELDQSVIKFVHKEQTEVQNFHKLEQKYLAEVKNRPGEAQPRADISAFISIQEPLLTSTLIPSFNSNLRLFNNSTGNCFTSDTVCSAFKQ